MNPEQARAAWVEALRSGEFEQTSDVLTRIRSNGETRHCCLGVACVLYNQIEGGLPTVYPEDGFGDSVVYDGFDQTLPPEVQEWLGLEDGSGSFWKDRAAASSLVALNDNGSTFEEIADVIESNPTGLIA